MGFDGSQWVLCGRLWTKRRALRRADLTEVRISLAEYHVRARGLHLGGVQGKHGGSRARRQ